MDAHLYLSVQQKHSGHFAQNVFIFIFFDLPLYPLGVGKILAVFRISSLQREGLSRVPVGVRMDPRNPFFRQPALEMQSMVCTASSARIAGDAVDLDDLSGKDRVQPSVGVARGFLPLKLFELVADWMAGR